MRLEMLLAVILVSALALARGEVSVTLNEFVDANLAFLEASFGYQLETNFENAFLSQEKVESADAVFSGVVVEWSSGLSRVGDVVQTLSEDPVYNTVEATLAVGSLNYSVSSLESAAFLGNTALRDFTVVVRDLQLILRANLTSDGSNCTLQVDMPLQVTGPASISSPYPFYNDMDITAFFQKNFIDVINAFNKSKYQDIPNFESLYCDTISTVLQMYELAIAQSRM